MFRWSVACAACLVLAGCGGDDEDPASLDQAILRSFYYRQSNEIVPGQDPGELEFEEKLLSISPNQVVVATLGALSLSARYSSDPYEGNVFSVGVLAGEARRL